LIDSHFEARRKEEEELVALKERIVSPCTAVSLYLIEKSSVDKKLNPLVHCQSLAESCIAMYRSDCSSHHQMASLHFCPLPQSLVLHLGTAHETLLHVLASE